MCRKSFNICRKFVHIRWCSRISSDLFALSVFCSTHQVKHWPRVSVSTSSKLLLLSSSHSLGRRSNENKAGQNVTDGIFYASVQNHDRAPTKLSAQMADSPLAQPQCPCGLVVLTVSTPRWLFHSGTHPHPKRPSAVFPRSLSDWLTCAQKENFFHVKLPERSQIFFFSPCTVTQEEWADNVLILWHDWAEQSVNKQSQWVFAVLEHIMNMLYKV